MSNLDQTASRSRSLAPIVVMVLLVIVTAATGWNGVMCLSIALVALVVTVVAGVDQRIRNWIAQRHPENRDHQ